MRGKNFHDNPNIRLRKRRMNRGRDASFDAGLDHALCSPGLMQSAFSVRTLSLFERMPLNERPSYLSGLVIGEELRTLHPIGDEAITVIGDHALTRRYERALARCGVQAHSVGAQAAWNGLWSLAQRITP